MRLGRADHRPVAHNDPDAFADAIVAWRRAGGTGRVWIAVESLYSMDGDRAPLAELAALAAAAIPTSGQAPKYSLFCRPR